MRKILFATILLLQSCNLYINPQNNNIVNFEKDAKLHKEHYEIIKNEYKNNQTFIEATLTMEGKQRLLTTHKFISSTEYDLRQKAKSHIKFKLHNIDVLDADKLYYLNDTFSNFYAYYLLIYDKTNNNLIYCLEYGD